MRRLRYSRIRPRLLHLRLLLRLLGCLRCLGTYLLLLLLLHVRYKELVFGLNGLRNRVKLGSLDCRVNIEVPSMSSNHFGKHRLFACADATDL